MPGKGLGQVPSSSRPLRDGETINSGERVEVHEGCRFASEWHSRAANTRLIRPGSRPDMVHT